MNNAVRAYKKLYHRLGLVSLYIHKNAKNLNVELLYDLPYHAIEGLLRTYETEAMSTKQGLDDFDDETVKLSHAEYARIPKSVRFKHHHSFGHTYGVRFDEISFSFGPFDPCDTPVFFDVMRAKYPGVSFKVIKARKAIDANSNGTYDQKTVQDYLLTYVYLLRLAVKQRIARFTDRYGVGQAKIDDFNRRVMAITNGPYSFRHVFGRNLSDVDRVLNPKVHKKHLKLN